MPSWTTVPAWAVGQIIKRVDLNRVVTAIGELQTWATADDARIATLESFVGTSTTRPQLRVFAPASNTFNAVVPYATVRKDTHSGWSGSSLYEYTVPLSGLYLVAIEWKGGGTSTAPSQRLEVGGNSMFSGPNAVSATYSGGHLSGVIDLTVSSVVRVVEQGASYTPSNDTTGSIGTGSNYFHLTYLGPTT